MRERFVAIFLVFTLFTPLAMAVDSTITLKTLIPVSENDLGINSAELSPNGENVLLVGNSGYAHLISASDPGARSKDVQIQTSRSTELNDLSWHPQGKTALIIGEGGTAIRYKSSNHAIETMEHSGDVAGVDLTTIQWRRSGDVAYVGTADGELYRYNAGDGFVLIDDVASSEISDIACHASHSICLVTSYSDGIAVIDQDHSVTWISETSENAWVAAICPDAQSNDCTAAASGVRVELITLNPSDPSKSKPVGTQVVEGIEGETIGICQGHGTSSIMMLTPFSMLRYKQLSDDSYALIMHDDAQNDIPEQSGETLVIAWEEKSREGFYITSEGGVGSFSPLVQEAEMDLVSLAIMVAVIIAVPGVLLGLTYMNSKTLQNWYMNYRRRSREKRLKKREESESS